MEINNVGIGIFLLLEHFLL